MGKQTVEHVEYSKVETYGANAQVYVRSSGSLLRRIYIKGIDCIRFILGRNTRKISQAFLQAEREVWDILDCGPRNSFTCENRLVHNSGTIVRFADDFSDVYYNGLDKLHQGEKLDKKIRKDEEHIERACPKCGYKPCGKRCVQCGWQKKKQSLEEHAAGEMKEITIAGKKAADDKKHLYRQLVSFTRNSSSQKPREWAWNLYKQITGEHVPKKWEGEYWMMPACNVTEATKGKIQQLRIAFRHAIK